ncbi:MAG: hypothetical protein GEU73_03645 [Chloroflexi bacterium]|nr:hypothetical protein [Chloroflexota bacterium]
MHYRERWAAHDEPGDEGCALLYQIVCLLDTPPLSPEEQARCMSSARGCWRLQGEAMDPAQGATAETAAAGAGRPGS